MRVKHRGAVERSFEPLQAITHRLLALPNAPSLSAKPRAWVEEALAWLRRPGQTRDDITRRSAGLPMIFLGLACGEATISAGTKALIARIFQSLLDTAMGREEGAARGVRVGVELTGVGRNQPTYADAYERSWPRCHAFNALRLLFWANALQSPAAAFHASGLEGAIEALGDAHWEVRNSAMLAYSALTTRMVSHGLRSFTSEG